MNNIEALEKYALSLECSAERGVSMKNYTSFKVGGPAELFLSPEDAGQTAKLVRFCEKEDIPVFVLGKGSNVLVSDKGIKGAVIFTGKQCGITLTDENTVRAQSGASLAQLCSFALENSLSGLEFAYGIPGTVGGAVFMNAGAYGGEMKDVLINSEYVSLDGTSGELDNEAMQLSYRHSAYEDSGLVITVASVRLTPGDPEQIKIPCTISFPAAGISSRLNIPARAAHSSAPRVILRAHSLNSADSRVSASAARRSARSTRDS